jgi:hypothetical protein
MKMLDILRSKPTDLVQMLVRRTYEGEQKKEVPLYAGPVNYDEVVRDIFESDRVICWW